MVVCPVKNNHTSDDLMGDVKYPFSIPVISRQYQAFEVQIGEADKLCISNFPSKCDFVGAQRGFARPPDT